MVIKNDKEVSIDSIEMIGATDKNSSSHIGKFGSGSKMAIAAAIRNDIDIRICSGKKIIKFDTKEVALSRSNVHRITMQIDNAKPKERDWTTAMGKHDWIDKPDEGVTVQWMIAREFFSNALDENGFVSISIEDKISPEEGKTKVYLRLDDKFEEIINNLSYYFPRYTNKREVVSSNQYGQVYAPLTENGAVYCKGVFVRKFPTKLLYDYDLTYLSLTESRTVDVWSFSNHLGLLLSSCDSVFLANFLSKLSRTECFENSLDSYHLKFNSDETKKAFNTAFGQNAYLCPSSLNAGAADYLSRLPQTRVILPEKWRSALELAGVTNYIQLIDKDVISGYSYVQHQDVQFRIEPVVRSKTERAFDYCVEYFNVSEPPELRYFFWTGTPESMPLGNYSNGKIGINAEISTNNTLILSTMIEEFAHYLSGAPDLSRELVNFLTNAIAENANNQL